MAHWGRWLAGTALAFGLGSGTALAGGFQRGVADTDTLYEPGEFVTRLGFTYVSPERGFTSVNGVSGDFGDYTGTYRIPSVALKYGGDMGACVGNYTESFAAEGDYSGLPGGAQPAPIGGGSRVRNLEFQSNEVSATCRVSYSANGMRFSLLGGIYGEDFDFQGESLATRNIGATLPVALQGALTRANAQLLLPVSVSVDTSDDMTVGYRIGAAFEIPEYAVRAQVLYRSEVEHDSITGTGNVASTGSAFVRLANGREVSVPTALGALGITAPPALLGALPAPGTVLASGLPAFQNTATSPQSLYVNAQTGIAEGTLLLASFRWTDWSTNRAVVTTTAGASSVSPYYWDDGYTASIGIGRAFNERISGSVSIGYDTGVSTGAETTYTDLYTLSGGLSLKDTWAELRVGGLIGYWTDGSQSIDRGAIYNGTVGDDWVYAASASLKLTF
ncbi:long-chain fatty acid transporter [Aureimonas jatrophae]|uniref:Long-chain fatty acid transport protein n=1 Tax=Aureimonas jatrophae TaxID=1166073 RepID=A0A1H0MTC3_9HYPH|nr:long-chain fatty acid transporter [Aureimonas jatrophae]MBB3951230.1 long-chain fatty acid transport protein [Aureimonas jatrophae]SDO83699.1 long-chain fatty acid transport protein [Aureimonas jatrophae]